jgi:prophage regulatory protein
MEPTGTSGHRRIPLDLQPSQLDRLLREPEVKAATGLSRSQRYRMVKAGTFPAPVRISERASAWRQSQIAEWLAGLKPAAVGSPKQDAAA